MTTEKTAVMEELPPFSFSKKPIKSVHLHSSISSYISQVVQPKSQIPQKPSLNNINYDEQIRAPRMSSANHYTYKPELPKPFTDKGTKGRQTLQFSCEGAGQYNLDAQDLKDCQSTQTDESIFVSSEADKCDLSIESNDLQVGITSKNADEGPEKESIGSAAIENVHLRSDRSTTKITPYLPARADINKPTRRSLEPQVPRWDYHSNLLGYDSHIVEPLRPKTDSSVSNFLDYSDGSTAMLSGLKLRRAIDNLNQNVTTAERHAALNSVDIKMSSNPTVTNHGPSIKQVYHMKKPMCLPAVLRPVTSESIPFKEFEGAGSPETSAANMMMEMESCINAIPKQVSLEIPDDLQEIDGKVEPTHEHWKPNNSTDHCLRCFGEFGGFFIPQRLRRHHCRFCGMLFCQNCLYNNRKMHIFEIDSPVADVLGSSSGDEHEMEQVQTNTSANNSKLHLTSVLFDESADGVMLDSKARFVIPILRNLLIEGASALQQKHKVCKVCKTCGNGYSMVLQLINLRGGIKEDISAGYVFIENPYLNNQSEGETVEMTTSRKTAPERRTLLATNLTSDWTWSSF